MGKYLFKFTYYKANMVKKYTIFSYSQDLSNSGRNKSDISKMITKATTHAKVIISLL